jgi:hypothetical protein
MIRRGCVALDRDTLPGRSFHNLPLEPFDQVEKILSA